MSDASPSDAPSSSPSSDASASGDVASGPRPLSRTASKWFVVLSLLIAFGGSFGAALYLVESARENQSGDATPDTTQTPSSTSTPPSSDTSRVSPESP